MQPALCPSQPSSLPLPATRAPRRGPGAAFLARVCQYLETPQYLRKALIPMNTDLRLAVGGLGYGSALPRPFGWVGVHGVLPATARLPWGLADHPGAACASRRCPPRTGSIGEWDRHW
jgi:hypothetical protein